MTRIATITRHAIADVTRIAVLTGALMLLLVLSGNAQTTRSATDGMTPLGLAPGSPAGSYLLSDFDNINLYNGNLNIRLPLLQVGGRGGARMTMMQAVNNKSWRVKYTYREEPYIESWAPEPNRWFGRDQGYGPGVLSGRQAGTFTQPCGFGPTMWVHALTRLTFTAPDGTEYELRDQQTGGQPLPTNCNTTGSPRGTHFVSTDGTAVTFVSDVEIRDNPRFTNLGGRISPSGYLYMRDGTRYRIDNGLVSRIRDRNGNTIDFLYDANGRVYRITDSLNRQVNIYYMVSDPVYGSHDQIVYNGFNGAQRIIRIAKYNSLETAFRPGASYVKKTYAQLFPELNGSQTTHYNPSVITQIWLPDGRSYRFYYNPYGEVERVELPTGGVVEYRMTPGSGVVTTGGDYQIYRRVVERHVYADGTSLESKTIYTVNQSGPSDPRPWSTTVTVDQKNASSVTLAYSKHFFRGSGLASLFSTYSAYLYSAWDEGQEHKTEMFDTNGSTRWRRKQDTYQQRASVWWWSSWASQQHLDPALEPPLDPRLTESVATLYDTGTNPNQVSKQTFAYDQFNNQTAVEEYDYGASAAPTHPTRRTETDYVGISEVNGLDYTGTSIHLRSLPQERRVYAVNTSTGARTLAASAHFYYDQYTLTARSSLIGWEAPPTAGRGNLTSTTRWLDTPSGSVTTTQKYDIAGNVVETTDARGQTSRIDFSSAMNAYAFPTLMKTPKPDLTGQRGSSNELQTAYDYDYASGLLRSVTDPNGKTTTADYNDPLDRLTAVVPPPGGGQITYAYGDTPGNLYVQTQTAQSVTQTLTSTTYFDKLGRVIRTAHSEGGTTVFTDAQYDALGRVSQVSNPYRSGDTVLRWTVTDYDALSRVKRETKPGGAVYTTNYSGNSITATDPDVKARKTVKDALGRVTQVVEDPGTAPRLNLQTDYTYDALDNLRKVTQGSQVRYFMYDSLSRLIRARNPEQAVNSSLPPLTDPVTSNNQWSVGHAYDGNGNLTARTDPRNITCNYTYDNLNRATIRSYANDPNQTPTVEYKYDGAGGSVPNALDRMTSVTTSGTFASSYTYNSFDAMGRVLSSTQTTDGQPYTMSYQWDLVGHLIAETYPSNRTVTTGYDPAGRISSVKVGANVYADAFSYAPHGGVTDLRLGNNLWEHTIFDPDRLQATEIGLGTARGSSDRLKLNYGYGTTTNNGNVRTHTLTIPNGPTLTQTYTYDELNRLRQAEENGGSSWRQAFLYDRYGNRTIDVTLTTPGLVGPNPQISSSTNRITSAGYLYDAAGNLTRDGAGHTYDYDGENLQIRYDGTAAQYFYDGQERRVKRVTGGVTTVYVYDALGKLVAEYTSNQPAGGGASYLSGDGLGSPRINTGAGGEVKARHDYLPFGEELFPPYGGRTGGQGYVADSVRQKFTGKERDVETGLDYFGARYYASALGRFMSADTVGGSGTNPQSLNLYAYVMNNPLAYVDPTGHIVEPSNDRLNDWADAKEAEFNEWVDEIDSRQAEQQAIKEGEKQIDAVAASGGELVLSQTGINNPTADRAADERGALGERWSPDQIVTVLNNSGGFTALRGKPDKSSAAAMVYLINYAIKANIPTEKITIVAHSNGVPTLSLALSNLSQTRPGVKFKEILLIAPNTNSASRIETIAKHSSNVSLVSSKNDNRLRLAILGGRRKPSSWRDVLKNRASHVKVYETFNKGHGIKYYFEELRHLRYRRLE